VEESLSDRAWASAHEGVEVQDAGRPSSMPAARAMACRGGQRDSRDAGQWSRWKWKAFRAVGQPSRWGGQSPHLPARLAA
jgi:hypothetical protein